MTQSVDPFAPGASWVDEFLRPRAKAAKAEGQLLWVCFCPSFERSALEWIEKVRRDFRETLGNFRLERVDSVLAPELDQAAQTLMQSMTGAQGWPVNLIIEPDTLKPIIGFAALELSGLGTLLEQVTGAWAQDPKRLQHFAEMSYFKASSQDPLRFAADPGQCFRSLAEAAPFFVAPMLQSFSSESGSFGVADGALLYPAAYIGLSEDSPRAGGAPNVGEAALAALIRGAAFDPLAASFFRVAGGPESAPAYLVKTLGENAEMLDAVVRVWARTRSPLLYDTAVELVGTLVDDFLAPEGFVAWLGAARETLAFGSADLLALDAQVRAVSQEFFSIRAGGRLPVLSKNVDDVAKALGLAPQEALLAAKRAGRELGRLRKKRAGGQLWNAGPVDRAAELRALEAIAFALGQLGSAQLAQHVVPKIWPFAERALIGGAPLKTRELAARSGLKLELLECACAFGAKDPGSPFAGTLGARMAAWAEELKDEVLGLQFVDFTVDTGFLGTRYDLVDHLGASGMAEQLRVLARAAKPLRCGSFARYFEKGESFIFEETLLGLSRVKRLGLVAASLYAGARAFFEGRAEPERPASVETSVP